jgi:hypothetical protein
MNVSSGYWEVTLMNFFQISIVAGLAKQLSARYNGGLE